MKDFIRLREQMKNKKIRCLMYEGIQANRGPTFHSKLIDRTYLNEVSALSCGFILDLLQNRLRWSEIRNLSTR